MVVNTLALAAAFNYAGFLNLKVTRRFLVR